MVRLGSRAAKLIVQEPVNAPYKSREIQRGDNRHQYKEPQNISTQAGRKSDAVLAYRVQCPASQEQEPTYQRDNQPFRPKENCRERNQRQNRVTLKDRR